MYLRVHLHSDPPFRSTLYALDELKNRILFVIWQSATDMRIILASLVGIAHMLRIGAVHTNGSDWRHVLNYELRPCLSWRARTLMIGCCVFNEKGRLRFDELEVSSRVTSHAHVWATHVNISWFCLRLWFMEGMHMSVKKWYMINYSVPLILSPDCNFRQPNLPTELFSLPAAAVLFQPPPEPARSGGGECANAWRTSKKAFECTDQSLT